MNPNTAEPVKLTVQRLRLWPVIEPGQPESPAGWVAEARIAETGGFEFGFALYKDLALDQVKADCRSKGIDIDVQVEELSAPPAHEELRVIEGRHWDDRPLDNDPAKAKTVAYRVRLTSGAVLTVKGLRTLREAQAAVQGEIVKSTYRKYGHYILNHSVNPKTPADATPEL